MLTSFSVQDGSEARTVQLFRYEGWAGEVGGDTTDMLNLLDTIVKSHVTANTNQLIVQCRCSTKKKQQQKKERKKMLFLLLFLFLSSKVP